MILTYKNYLKLKSALIKYFVDNNIDYDKGRAKKFYVEHNLCRDLVEAKMINKVFLDRSISVLVTIDKIIFLHFVKYDTLYENVYGDIQRLQGNTYKEKWKHFRSLYK